MIEYERQLDYFKELSCFVDDEYNRGEVFPPVDDVFRCFECCDYEDVKVVILGQDPYHDVNQANGLAFSVNKGVKFPPSLRNIFKEAVDDVHIEWPSHGDLTCWAKQGVLLMNTVLTVRAHAANSHKGRGWEVFSDHMIEMLNKHERPLVFILWGQQAILKEKMIDTHKHCVIKSVHPSPLSAYRGFFGSRPFSKANAFLRSQGLKEIDWRVV